MREAVGNFPLTDKGQRPQSPCVVVYRKSLSNLTPRYGFDVHYAIGFFEGGALYKRALLAAQGLITGATRV